MACFLYNDSFKNGVLILFWNDEAFSFQCLVCVIHAAIQTSHTQKSSIYATNTEKFLPVKQNVL